MKVSYTHLCDHALYSMDGKPSIIGVYSRIYAETVPTLHFNSFFAFGIDVQPSDAGTTLHARVVCTDPEGQPILEIGGTLTVAHLGGTLIGPGTIHQIVRLPPLALKAFGVYRLRVIVNEEDVNDGLRVEVVPSEASEQAGADKALQADKQDA